jgi:hypothetical protein
MRPILQWLGVGRHHGGNIASLNPKRALTEAELDRIAAAGGDPNGALGGGNVRSTAEWPPPPRLN